MTSSIGRGLALRHVAAALVIASLGMSGCGKKTASVPTKEEDAPASVQVQGRTVEATPVAASSARGPQKRDRLHQAFATAVRSADDPPPGDAVRPPDQTVSRKPAHRILEGVKAAWDDIRFTTETGKKLDWTAKIETSQGTIEIALFPEQAPNHVRNFLALARTGYYDELFVERIRHEQNPMTGQELHMLEAGCPLGTGATGTGSIGYWLKEEFTPPGVMSHDEGTVGACRGEEPDSAATRFYITLNRAAFLDGNYTIFGKVITGLDVLRRIGQSPVVIDDEGNSRPEKPVSIHRVTIHAREVAGK